MLKTLQGNRLVPVGFLLRLQGGLDVIQMRFHRRAGRTGVAVLQGRIDGAVLVQQGRAGRALLEHDLPIVKHAFAQQLEHGAHHVQHDDVVARLDDCHVEFGVKAGLIRRVPLGMSGFHLGEQGIDKHQVGVRAEGGGAFGRHRLHVAAEREVIEHRLVMRREKLDQRGREGRAKHISNKDARARARGQQATLLQFRHGVAQAGARHAQRVREIAFRRKPLAWTQDAAQDQKLDLANNGGGEFFGVNLAEGHR
ncbi:hypothetical protein GALL_538630 [mine drainage metagenome]|uniref:Uncharacterized protein n=1 Tax=mine drainage metagenome TaxID=410659 RepID=A0A1J5NZ93_9ZZZZ